VQSDALVRSRRETREGQQRYDELFDFAPIGYAVLAGDEMLTALNHVGAQMLGAERALLLGRRFDQRVAVRDRPAFAALLHLLRSGSARASAELQLVDGDAPTVVRLTAAMVSRHSTSFLLAFADITDERRRIAELAQAEKALREEDRRKDEFLAMLSHELRNPLTPIRSSLYLLDRAPPGSEAATKARQVIERQVTHLSRIVDDLLEVTRITRGKVMLRRTRLDLAALVARTIEDHRVHFADHGLQLEARIQSGPSWVDADPTRIVQALSNLLGNSRKFTPRGGRVDVRLQRVGTRTELTVRDTGAGIARDILAHVFEPFSQAPQTLDRSVGGLGLGLATVKGLIELHGGSVAIASDGVDRGTQVTLRLPLVDAPGELAAALAPVREERRRVVVIEDNRDTADGLEAVLALRGHEVRVAHDGPSGIEVIRSFRPAVVICDLGLPGIDGYSVASILRGDRALGRMFLVSLSGYARPEDVRRATAAGFDRHIAKPPDLEELERMIAEAR
jgi:two-component system CheB/CheR fusion protein